MDMMAMERAIAAYAPQGDDADRARLEFFAGLYRLQDEWAHRVAAESGYPAPAAEQLEAWYWNADPAFQFAPVSIDAERFAQTLSAMAGYLAEKAGLEEAAAKGLSECDWDAFSQKADLALAGRDPAAFVESCLTGLDSYGVGADVHRRQAPDDRHNHDCPLDCPVCGTPASASFVGEAAGTDGRGRMQYCAMCGAQWPYERIRCGVCGTFNQTKLHYFNLEGDNAHRIQSCDACGQYQRVVFQDDIPGPLCMEVEDVVMAKLDKVALDPRFRKEVG